MISWAVFFLGAGLVLYSLVRELFYEDFVGNDPGGDFRALVGLLLLAFSPVLERLT